MSTALAISDRFAGEILVPLLKRDHPALIDRIAIGAAGTGSDILGLDDEISRDHHWGPRACILLRDDDEDDFGDAVRRTLVDKLPVSFEGHPVHLDRANRTAVCVDSIGGFLHWFLGTSKPPERDEEWFALCETDLLHVTGGAVFHDPSMEWSRLRRRLSYYPDAVWRKRLADWCMYVTGRDAPYNLHRVTRRGEDVAAQIYLGLALRRVMELGFALERQYAPYPKWQHRLFKRLGGVAHDALPLIDEIIASDQWRRRVDLLIEINHLYARRLHALELTEAPVRHPFDEGLTDLVLYSSATQLYAGLPPEWLRQSFNQIESWEKLARMVLFDREDYFQAKFGAGK